MTENYTLNRTGRPPLAFEGEQLAKLVSAGRPTDMSDSRHARWFEWDIYRTEGGTYVAHVRFRAGVLLNREIPMDTAVHAKTPDELTGLLQRLDWTPWIAGWPDDGRYDDRNVDLMRRLKNEWLQLLVLTVDATKPTEAEVLA